MVKNKHTITLQEKVCIWNQNTFHSSSFEVFWEAKLNRNARSLQLWQTIILTTFFFRLSMHIVAVNTKKKVIHKRSLTLWEAQFKYKLRPLQFLQTKKHR